MKTIRINRIWGNDKQSLGSLVVVNEFQQPLFAALSLERGWLDNEPNISCIPIGSYPIVLEYSSSFNEDLWEIKEVPNRSETKFHRANYWRQLNGCIALGLKATDIDGDGYMDITSSEDTMKAFHEIMGRDKQAILVIEN